jgi:transposase
MQPRPWPPIPEQTARVAKAAFPKASLAMTVRDELGEVFGDEQFAAAFATRGAPAESPGALALVTALQYAENLTDRQAAQMVARAIDWKYALGLELTDPGFDHSVLSKFRSRLVAHGLEEQVFSTLLATLTAKGLLKAGGKQRTDSTYVIAAVRDLNRLELAGESVRAAVEALAAAAPGWLAGVIDVPEWAHRYGARIDTWRLPTSSAKRDRLAQVYGTDALRLLRAVYAPGTPPWLARLPAVQVLRTVLLQNYYRSTDAHGREVIKRREADTEGLPPARVRITSPYDLDARWAAKGDELFWNGYKIHISEVCTDAAEDDRTCPNLITTVTTTDATVPDVAMTTPIHQALADRHLLPAEHYLDSGYPSVDTLVAAREAFGITLITPMLQDHSAPAKAQTGFAKSAFSVDWHTRQVTCPQGQTSTSWSRCVQHGREAIVVKFPGPTCRRCPARSSCTTATRGGRQLTLRPRELHEAAQAARAQQNTKTWQDTYALRAGVEGTVSQALAITGIRHARYRGLPKTHLQHVYSAVALNLIRLDAWWRGHPLDRRRSRHLTRLDHALAA